MTETSDYAIETKDLTKIYRSKLNYRDRGTPLLSFGKIKTVRAVNRLNLKVRKGELFGLLGPNGAGKTTLVKVLCTLLPPDEGTALVNGFDVVKQPMEVKQSLGTLFSVGERGFFWRLSGYSNLEFYAAIYNVPRRKIHDKIMEVLELVDMQDHATEYFQKYSGGMKRKMALARTLLADPPILLLDEPTTGLDVISSRSIREFIHNDLCKKRGKTVLYTTHYIEEASQICDRVAIMTKGKIIALDTPDALRAMTKKAEIVEVTLRNISENQINTLKAMSEVISVTAEIQDPIVNQRRLRIHLYNVDVLPKVLNFFLKENIRLVSFKHDEPTLEDAFIQIAGSGMMS